MNAHAHQVMAALGGRRVHLAAGVDDWTALVIDQELGFHEVSPEDQ